MNDKGKILAGLIIFLIVLLFPFWFNLLFGTAKAAKAPKPELTQKAKSAKHCVAATEFMRREHMHLLNLWRNTVVREGKREYVSGSGKVYMASLSKTCMDCHSNKEEFCDRCHNYASVRPYCWDCHTYPKKEKE